MNWQRNDTMSVSLKVYALMNISFASIYVNIQQGHVIKRDALFLTNEYKDSLYVYDILDKVVIVIL